MSPRSMSVRDRSGKPPRFVEKDSKDQEEVGSFESVKMGEEDGTASPRKMRSSVDHSQGHTLSQRAPSFTPSTSFVKSTPPLSRAISVSSSSNYSLLAEGALKIVMDSDGDDYSVNDMMMGEKKSVNQINALGLQTYQPFDRLTTNKGPTLKFNKVAVEDFKHKVVKSILKSLDVEESTESTTPSYAQITGKTMNIHLDQHKLSWQELKDHMDQFWETVVSDLSM